MSVVSNAILAWFELSVESPETPILAEVNAFFQNGRGFVHVSKPGDWYGGTKRLECDLAIGAFNYLDLDALVEHLETQVHWEESDRPQLMIREQDDDFFRILDLHPRPVSVDRQPNPEER